MIPENNLHKVAGRKPTQKKKPLRSSSLRYPNMLGEGEDAQEDVTAPRGEPAQHMNQSFFSMIATAGSKVDFNARIEEEESSDSDDEKKLMVVSRGAEKQSMDPWTQAQLDEQHEGRVRGEKLTGPQAKPVEHRDLRPLPRLDLRTFKEKNYVTQSLRLPSSEGRNELGCPTGVTPRDAPVMSMMLEARAEFIPSAPSQGTRETRAEESYTAVYKDTRIGLATRLMEIFGFERPEEVISGICRSRRRCKRLMVL